MEIKDLFIKKIDLFMNKYITDDMNPSSIYWWISLSGGKDSFALAHGLYTWYQINGYTFNGEGFLVRQWNQYLSYNKLFEQIPWMKISILEGVKETKEYTNYNKNQQAPCADCSFVRKRIGDSFIIENHKEGFKNILVRGSHLTDVAVSYLWRDFFHIDTIEYANQLVKAKPITRLDLPKEVYLAKPLYFTREFECQEYANALQFKALCCGCPACRFPSRRDIVEETLALVFDGPKWEFDVYGVSYYLKRIGAPENLESISLPGKETKHAHIPPAFFDFMIDIWSKTIQDSDNLAILKMDKESGYLDQTGLDYIKYHIINNGSSRQIPKLFDNTPLTNTEKALVATLGPFWGMIGCQDKELKKQYALIQDEIFGFTIDTKWEHLMKWLKMFYDKSGNIYHACCSEYK